jgi:hypothetical protein
MKQQLAEKYSMKIGCATDTPNGANNQVSATTCSSTDFPNNTKSKSWALLPMAIHQGRFSRQNDAPLAENTVTDTLNLVAATFQENGCKDPKKDVENNVGQLLGWQLRMYKKDDPKENNRKHCLFVSYT